MDDVPSYRAMKKMIEMFPLLSDGFRKRLLQGFVPIWEVLQLSGHIYMFLYELLINSFF